MVAYVAGLMYANAREWWIHKHVLLGVGKKRYSRWSFHLFQHHQASRRNAR